MNDIEGRLGSLEAPSPEGAVKRFVCESFREGKARVAYGSIPSPIGLLTAVVTHRGLAALAFETDDLEGLLQRVAAKLSPTIVRLGSAVGETRSWLDAYFSGWLEPSPPLDRSLITPFQNRVLSAAVSIPPGEVRTYGQVAAQAGNPKAARAAGRALATNPIPIILPCHRVVAADGALRGYAGGLDCKRLLIDHERAITIRR